MNIFRRFFGWVGNLFFEAAMVAMEKKVAQYARRSLQTWDRARKGKPPQDASLFIDEARKVLDDYKKRPMVGKESTVELALEVLKLAGEEP